jgi:sirohydrochlorin ferrochelatase
VSAASIGSVGRAAPGRPEPAGPPSLVLVGHGSRDPRSAGALAALTDRVRGARPAVGVHLAFLELSVPSVDQVLAGLDRPAVVVPLLLGAAYHARVDLPARLAAAGEANPYVPGQSARTLGSDAQLDDVLASAADQVGGDGYLLFGPGSSHVAANDEVHLRARRLSRRLQAPVRAAFVTTEPSVEEAVAALRSEGSRRPAALPWFLAPGRLMDRGLDQLEAAGVERTAGPLAFDSRLVGVVLSRYDEQVALHESERRGSIAR